MREKDSGWSAKLKITLLSLFTVVFAVILCVCMGNDSMLPSTSSPQTTYTLSAEKPSVTVSESTGEVSEEETETTPSETETTPEETESPEMQESEEKPEEEEENSGNYVYVTDTGTKYHKKGCQYLRSSSHKITVEKAKSGGKTPCSRCKP